MAFAFGYGKNLYGEHSYSYGTANVTVELTTGTGYSYGTYGQKGYGEGGDYLDLGLTLSLGTPSVGVAVDVVLTG